MLINGPDTLTEHSVARRQVALADTVFISKLDMMDAQQRTAAEPALQARVRALNGGALIGAADDSSLDIVQLLHASGLEPARSPEAAKAWLEQALRGDARHQEQLHAGHAHVHDDAIHSFSLVREAPVPRAALDLLLSSLERQLGPSLLRVKGVVHVAEVPEPRPLSRVPSTCCTT